MNRFVIVSGCSGGGKSTLLGELRRRGHAVVEEPGRRIVAEETGRGGTALPWIDGVAFARRAIEMSLADRAEAERQPGWVFFDRGLIDAAVALRHLAGDPFLDTLKQAHRSNDHVFLAPSWPEIYVSDPERRHGLAEAIAEYERLHDAYRMLGYDIALLPKTDVASRADFVLGILGIH